MTNTAQSLNENNNKAPDFLITRKVPGEGPFLRMQKVELKEGGSKRILVHAFNLALEKGQSAILTGPSGSGKSTLIRGIRGIHLDGSGIIETSADSDIACLSQEVHIPRGKIRTIFSKAGSLEPYTDEEIAEVLKDVGLEKLVEQVPSVQAKPEFLVEKMKPYLPLIERNYGHIVAASNEAQRDAMAKLAAEYIEQHAQDYFEKEVATLMDSYKKAHLSQLVKDMLDESLDNISDELAASRFAAIKPPKGAQPALGMGIVRKMMEGVELYDQVRSGAGKQLRQLFNFRTLARMRQEVGIALASDQVQCGKDMAQMLLQAAALELSHITKDGNELSHELSGGQQQMIGVARVLLRKPDILLMDEPTSKMDPKTTKHLYSKLMEGMKESVVFSIAHDMSLVEEHDFHIQLADQKITVTPVEQTAPEGP